jgi:hypothetical protein
MFCAARLRSDSLAEIDPNITFLLFCRDSYFVFAVSKEAFRTTRPGEAS